jgi:MSHA pilin protein MshD
MRTGEQGVTLIELVVFIIVISIALGAMLSVYNYSVRHSIDPLVRVRLVELAQSQLDVVLGAAYDGATPTGGVPACGSMTPQGPGPACSDSGGVRAFHGFFDNPYTGYSRSVEVVNAGADLFLANDQAKRITVTVSAPNGESLVLSAYRTNF